jgi:hypothetical protein
MKTKILVNGKEFDYEKMVFEYKGHDRIINITTRNCDSPSIEVKDNSKCREFLYLGVKLIKEVNGKTKVEKLYNTAYMLDKYYFKLPTPFCWRTTTCGCFYCGNSERKSLKELDDYILDYDNYGAILEKYNEQMKYKFENVKRLREERNYKRINKSCDVVNVANKLFSHIDKTESKLIQNDIKLDLIFTLLNMAGISSDHVCKDPVYDSYYITRHTVEKIYKFLSDHMYPSRLAYVRNKSRHNFTVSYNRNIELGGIEIANIA